MKRRGFLTGMLSLAAAPAVVKAENIMRIFVPPECKVVTPLYPCQFGKRGDHATDVFTFITKDGGETWQGKLAADFDGVAFYGKGVDPFAQRILDDLQKVPNSSTRAMTMAFQNSGKHSVMMPSGIRWQ